jgi:hypothetical protein
MARADREPLRAEASMPAAATHVGRQLNVFQVDPHVHLTLRFVDVLPPWARRSCILDHLEHGAAAQQAARTHATVRGTCWRRSVGIAPLRPAGRLTDQFGQVHERHAAHRAPTGAGPRWREQAETVKQNWRRRCPSACRSRAAMPRKHRPARLRGPCHFFG